MGPLLVPFLLEIGSPSGPHFRILGVYGKSPVYNLGEVRFRRKVNLGGRESKLNYHVLKLLICEESKLNHHVLKTVALSESQESVTMSLTEKQRARMERVMKVAQKKQKWI